jgi:transposase
LGHAGCDRVLADAEGKICIGTSPRGAMRALLAAGMPARQVNPFKLRQFARASGVLAKNDPLDARMIASFVAIMPTQPAQPRAPAIERLTEILAVRRQISAEKVAAENASIGLLKRAFEEKPRAQHRTLLHHLLAVRPALTLLCVRKATI